jgi:hypothetical protein
MLSMRSESLALSDQEESADAERDKRITGSI